MKRESIKQIREGLSQFKVSKEEALEVEGGPETDRGTVTSPAEDED